MTRTQLLLDKSANVMQASLLLQSLLVLRGYQLGRTVARSERLIEFEKQEGERVNIYLICPVRNSTFDSSAIVRELEAEGHKVHFPPRDVNQDDPTGVIICRLHLAAMKLCDRVDIVWDVNSKGSHFDLGMAWALGKPMRLIHALHPDTEGKSYQKVIELTATR